MSPSTRLHRLLPIRGLGVLAAALLLAVPSLSAQSGSLTGRVTDGESGQPIPSAQVFIAELDLGVLTQQGGGFSLQDVPAGAHVVTVQRLGYQEETADVTVTAGQTTVQNVVLQQTALQLDEVIVTGTPGGTQRRAIGNTVQRLEVSDITADVAVSNFQDLLGARTPGIRFSVLPGNVGTGSQITLRGVSSFSTGRNNPLIYVDGIRVNNSSSSGPSLGEGAAVNVLNDFNPEEIESIEIIKGPAAASLYGTEASSGVIQIITKRGTEGAPEFNFSVRQGANFVTDPAGRLGTMYACPDSPSPGCTRDELISYNMYEEANQYIREGYFDWPTPDLFSYGQAQGYNLDIRGGTSTIRYYLSGNWDDETGIVTYNNQQTMRLRGNMSVVFTDNLSVDVSTGYVKGHAQFDQATPGDGAIWQDLGWSNGTYLDRVTPFGTPGANPRLGGFQEHLPSDVREDTQATRDYDRFTGSATVNYTLSDLSLGFLGTTNLDQRFIVGIDKGWDVNRSLFLRETGAVPEHLREYLDDWRAVYTETASGEMTYARPINTSYSLDYAITTEMRPNDTWSFETAGGIQYNESQYDYFENSGQGFASPFSTTINQITQSNITTSYEYEEDKSLGVYVQEQIGWNDRVFLQAAVRWDDNSTFGADSDPRQYPKVSGTWVISEEGFWNIDAINSLRLRGAWGKAGRQPSALAGFNVYAAIPGPGGAPAIRPTSPGNPGIEPEISTELEGGFDFAMFDDRIAGDFTSFGRKTENLLLPVSILSSFGFPGSVDTNVGQIDAWGWEATIGIRVLERDSYNFDLDVSADYNDNKIRDLGTYPGTTSIRVGYPFPNVTEGDRVTSAEFVPEGTTPFTTTNVQGERIAAMCDPGISLAPDPDDPFQYNQYGVVAGGEPQPCEDIPDRDVLTGRGFSPYSFTLAPRLTLLEGALQVFALAEGQYGRWMHDNIHSWGHIYNNSAVSRVEDDPVWVASNNLNGTGSSREKALFKGDFWKLREVGARYSFPQSLVGRTGADRASLSISARNVWTIWKAQDEIYGHPVVDPEFGDQTSLSGQGNFYSSPGLSSINATLRVTF